MKNKTLRFLFITLLSGVVYLLFALPLRKVLAVFTVTDVRPAAALNPVLGISFGAPAALGIALGNAVADILSGYPSYMILFWILLQFIYSMVPYWLWNRLNRGEEHIHRFSSVSRVLKYTLCSLAYGILSACGVASYVNMTYGVPFFTCAGFVMMNNFTMAMLLGSPLMILLNVFMSRQAGTNRKLFFNEKILLIGSVAEIVIVSIIILCVYGKMGGGENFEIWNTIFIYSVIAVNGFIALMLAFITFAEKKLKIME